jgi:hypothetical protein
MKKFLVFISFLLFAGVHASAETLQYSYVHLQERVKPTKPLGGYPRSPIECPEIGIDGYTLYLSNVSYDITLVLVDSEGEDAYTVFIPAGTTSVVLPSTLSGEYELQLIPTIGDYYYCGDITL